MSAGSFGAAPSRPPPTGRECGTAARASRRTTIAPSRFLRRAAAWVLGVAAMSAAHALPTFAEVRAAHRPSDVTLLDRHGVAIQTVRVDKSVRRLPWVALSDMSPALLQALVLSEARRFYEHSGIDWSAVAHRA